MPYILVACMEAFDRASQSNRQINKLDLLLTMYIDDDLARRDPDTTLDHLRLTAEETAYLQTNRSSIFWFTRRRLQVLIECSIANLFIPKLKCLRLSVDASPDLPCSSLIPTTISNAQGYGRRFTWTLGYLHHSRKSIH